MSIGKQEESQGTLWLSYDQLPKSMGHAFYDHLQRLLLKGQFDSFAEKICEPYYAKAKGRPSVPPGRYFRMLLVGYFEGIDSERGICWRCCGTTGRRIKQCCRALSVDEDLHFPFLRHLGWYK